MAPSDNKMPDDEFTPLISVQFFMVTSVIGVVPVEPISNIFGLVTLVLLMVRFLELDPLLEPSIVTYLPRIRIIAALLTEPVMVALTPVLGLMVSVLVALAVALSLIVIGNVSEPEYVAEVKIKVTGPERQALL